MKYGDYGFVMARNRGYGNVRKTDLSGCNDPTFGAYERPNLPFRAIVPEMDEENSKMTFRSVFFFADVLHFRKIDKLLRLND